jgi:4-alpha-glucanotransferase
MPIRNYISLPNQQLLPVNDTNSTGTWTDSYPYAPYSVFALHPLYASMDRVGNLSDPLMQEIMEGKGMSARCLVVHSGTALY